jgi:hypothetical protein
MLALGQENALEPALPSGPNAHDVIDASRWHSFADQSVADP